MATIKFVKKESAVPPGNFQYTYECKCGNGTKKNVVVQSANDNAAKQLAQLECDEVCGET